MRRLVKQGVLCNDHLMNPELKLENSKRTGMRVLVGLLAAWALLLPFNFPSNAEAAPKPTITGVIVDKDGAPLADLDVSFSVSERGWPDRDSTTTAADGSFTLKQPKSGTRFSLYVRDNTQGEPQPRVLDTWISSRGVQSWTDWNKPTEYRARTSNINSGTHALSPSSGFAIDATGPQPDDVRVHIRRGDKKIIYWGDSTSHDRETGRKGLDTLTYGFIPGQYIVDVYASGFKANSQAVTLAADQVLPISVALIPGGDPDDSDDDAKGTATLSGQYTALGKKAHGDITLIKGGEVTEGWTNSNGKFRMKGLEAGTYRLRFVDDKTRRFSSVKVTIKKGQDRVIKPKNATRKTFTLSGSALIDSELTLKRSDGPTYYSSAKYRTVNGKPALRGSYKFTHLVPGTYSMHVTARDDYGDSFGAEVDYAPRTYKKITLSKDRSLKVTDGGKAGSIKAELRWAGNNQVITWAPIVTQACKGNHCMRLTDMALTGGQPILTGLDSKPYRIEVMEADLDEEMGPFTDPDEKSPYYLTGPTKVVRAKKGTTVDGGTILITVNGGLS